MIEAVIALPVFALVLAGIGYFHGLVVAKQETAQSARKLAWQTAVDGCRGNSAANTRVETQAPAAGADRIADAANERASTRPDALFPSLDKIPVVGSLISTLTPRGVLATKKRHVHKPKLFAQDSGTAQSDAFVQCNERHGDPWQTTLAVFTSLMPGVGD